MDTQTSVSLPVAEDHVDTDSEVSDASDDGGDAGVEAPDVPRSTVAVSDCVFLLNEQSMVAHFAQPCEDFDPQLMCRFDWQGTVRCFKFACRARKAVGDSAIIPAESVPASYRICLRAACSRAFD